MMRGDLQALNETLDLVWLGGLQLDGLTPWVGMELATPQAPGPLGVVDGAPGELGIWRVDGVRAAVDSTKGPRLLVTASPLNPEAEWAICKAWELQQERLARADQGRKD